MHADSGSNMPHDSRAAEQSASTLTMSFATVARREAISVLKRLVLVFVLVAVPLVGILRYAAFQQKNEELTAAFISTVSYSVALNDTFQIQRAIEGFRRELGAESITLEEVKEKGMKWASTEVKGAARFPHQQIIDLKAPEAMDAEQSFRVTLIVPLPVLSMLAEVGLLFLLSLSIFWFLSAQVLSLANRLSRPILALSAEFEAGQVSCSTSSAVTEIEVLRARVKEYEQRLTENNKRISDAELQEEKARIAHQVAHDIRSPLVVFNMINELLPDAPEETRRMFKNAAQRVHDIANDLIRRFTKQTLALTLPALEIRMLSDLIDDAIAEKRIQVSGQRHIVINTDFSRAYGLFVELSSPSNILRAISNILNNSIDAFGESGGSITVSLDGDRDTCQVAIADTGRGIPEEVLLRLGHERISFGKSTSLSGSGIGVLQVKDAVDSEGGDMKIESEEGVGTTVKLRFPRVQPPSWFVPAISLTSRTTIVSVDDDPSIHEVWAARVSALSKEFPDLRHRIFHSTQGAGAWAKYLESSFGDVLFLVDYEFRDSEESGVDFILGLPLHVRSVLVTSKSHDPLLLNRLQQNSVQMVSKQAATLLPIVLQPSLPNRVHPELHV